MTSEDFLPTKLLWLDLEMTGLDLRKDVVLEVGVVVTDFDLKPLGSFEAVIARDKDILDNMNEWSVQHHNESGLVERIRKEGKPEELVISELADFIKLHHGSEPAVLAGNTIHNDRTFIRLQWPNVESLLFHRMVDVSSLKILMQVKYGVYFPKDKAHRALDDIGLSIAELQYYFDWFKRNDRSQDG